MYTSLEIKGFRCFKHLTIPKLARLNLIGGKNNTGKTALLEAVCLRAAGVYAPADVLLTMYESRGLPWKQTLAHFSFRDLFTRGTDSWEAHLTTGVETPEAETVRLAGSATREVVVSVAPEERGSTTQDGNPRTPSAGLMNIEITLSKHGNRLRRAFAEWRGNEINVGVQEPMAAPTGTQFLLTRGITRPQLVAQRFGVLQMNADEGRVERALALIEPTLRELEVVQVGEVPVIFADLGEPPRVPLGLLGEGMNRALEAMTALCTVPGGRVLLDEIENGLHYSVLPNVWRAIASAATELDVQVFATTHSYECVEAAREATAEMPEGTFLYHRLDRTDEGIRCVTYEPETLEAALQMPWEVR